MEFPQDLCIGDILLYHGKSFFNIVTDLKTGGQSDHVEIYAGDGQTVASRPEGFNVFPFKEQGLIKVRRPQVEFWKDAADVWLEPLKGMKYDAIGLFQFFNLDWSNNSFICSVGAAHYLKAGRCVMFADDYPLAKISPRDFELTTQALTVWKKPFPI